MFSKKIRKKAKSAAIKYGIRYATYAAKSVSDDRKKRRAQYEADQKKYGGGSRFFRR